MKRSMKNTFEGKTFYESTFETTTGVLVREVEARPRGRDRFTDLLDWLMHGMPYEKRDVFRKDWEALYAFRREPFSPSPETVDISITDWCDFGCTYCYQDSTAKQRHAPSDLVDKVIKSFAHPPYQIAIGGGEPTAHPDFPNILMRARELGTVPNYTTAGHIVRPEVVEATNQVGGGVAMTFHAWKGVDWFKEHYSKLRSVLKVQLNVHLIADKDVATNLETLTALQKDVGKLNVVLLAYYPDVGRGTMTGIMPKTVYNETFPLAITRAISNKMTLAFSEGLLPFFLSRPELGIETKFASRAEGNFSAYVDPRGRMSHSSFDPPPKPTDTLRPFKDETEKDLKTRLEGQLDHYKTVWEGSLQEQWNRMRSWNIQPHGGSCYDCKHADSCAMPDVNHYLVCAYASHNGKDIPLNTDAQAQEDEMLIVNELMAAEKVLGRKMTDEEYEPYRTRFRAIRAKLEEED